MSPIAIFILVSETTHPAGFSTSEEMAKSLIRGTKPVFGIGQQASGYEDKFCIAVEQRV